MSNNIVTVNVTQQVAPTPETLQSTGAMVSQGGTILAPGTSSILTQLSDLTPLLTGAKTIASLSWSGGIVTVTTSQPHGFEVSDTIELTIAGALPAGYNGTFQCSITGASTFTYPLTSNPGTATSTGSFTPEDVAELLAMATTFFAQGSQQAAFVLELGAGSVADGVAALSAYLTANPNSAYTPGAAGFFYSYLVPREWDGNASFIALLAEFTSTTAKTYFFVTTTLTNYPLYSNLLKCAILLIEAPQLAPCSQNPLTAITWSSGVVTATTTSAHGLLPGDWFQIQGCLPVGYNGWWQAQAGTTGSTLVYNVPSNPGAETSLGTLEAQQATQSAIPVTEFSHAADWRVTLNYDPSPTNKVTPFAFSFLFGVTPFPLQGMSATLSSLKAANINFVATGAEGGISNTIIKWGTTADGRDFTYWYSIDWAAINSDVNLANAVINGSNDPINPLYYSQNGIDRLQDVEVATLKSAISNGLALGPVVKAQLGPDDFVAALEAGTYDGQMVVNAVPFATYLAANPGDFKIEKYSGLSAQYIPNRGFTAIVFNLNVTDFIAG